MVNAEGRLRDSELSSDGPGMSGSKSGQRSGHPMRPERSAHEQSADVFARDIAALLTRSANDRAYEQLVLVAPPAFLGKLRAELDGPVAQLVKGSLNRELTTETPNAILGHLPNPWG